MMVMVPVRPTVLLVLCLLLVNALLGNCISRAEEARDTTVSDVCPQSFGHRSFSTNTTTANSTTLHLNAKGCVGGTLYLAAASGASAGEDTLTLQLDVCAEEDLLALLRAPHATPDAPYLVSFDIPCAEELSGAERPQQQSMSLAVWTTATTLGALALAGREGEPTQARWAAGVAVVLLASAATCSGGATTANKATDDFVAIAHIPEGWPGKVTADANVNVIDLRSPTPTPTLTPTSPSPSPSSSSALPMMSPTPSSSPSPSPSASPASVVHRFSFIDTPADDVPATALETFFSGFTAATTDYISFAIDTKGGSANAGQWCAERADWYRDTYLTSFTAGSGQSYSGSWQKWSRPEGGAWSAATTAPHANFYGTDCHASAGDWCSEWNNGGIRLVVMPANTTTECAASPDFSLGADWVVTITVAATRQLACGF